MYVVRDVFMGSLAIEFKTDTQIFSYDSRHWLCIDANGHIISEFDGIYFFSFLAFAAFRHRPGRSDHVRERQHERVVLLASYAAATAATGGGHEFGCGISREQNPSKWRFPLCALTVESNVVHVRRKFN